MRLYRQTRQEAQRLLSEIRKRGYGQVCIEGDPRNDLVDVCRLTCLEQGVKVIDSARGGGQEDEVPMLRVDSRELSLKWPGGQGDPSD